MSVLTDYHSYRHTTHQDIFVHYTANTSHLLPFYPIHWHEEAEFVQITDGCGYVTVEGERYTANKGDIFLFRPFELHSFVYDKDSAMQIRAVVFNLRLIDNANKNSTLAYFATLINNSQIFPCKITSQFTWYDKFCQSVDELMQQDISVSGLSLKLQSAFRLLYDNRLTDSKQNVTDAKRCYTIRLALEYIRANYMNAITITDVAKHCGYSEFYLMKLFKQFVGIPCVDYANNYRLTIAGMLLLDTTDDVSSIAYQVGFNNVSYFNRQFKSLYDTTPKVFRQTFTK